ncbi:MAG: hypothetical protein EAZ55_11710 [Cytophagales bacterium]|nr:MAG: hypothetical protein EAZ55_11710 [Cytophagales bacterium]
MKAKPNFDFFRTTMPKTRKADFYLGCLEGSVFIDFNYSSKRRIYLCRISFDGFGCCNIDSNDVICLDEQSSKEFVNEIDKDELNQEKMTKLVLALIQLNKSNIWQDALKQYGFI